MKMPDYGIEPAEFEKMVQNARDTLGVKFRNDLSPLTDEDWVAIYQKPYH